MIFTPFEVNFSLALQAHGGAVLHHAGKYYWYGVKNSGYTYFNENNLLRWAKPGLLSRAQGSLAFCLSTWQHIQANLLLCVPLTHTTMPPAGSWWLPRTARMMCQLSQHPLQSACMPRRCKWSAGCPVPTLMASMSTPPLIWSTGKKKVRTWMAACRITGSDMHRSSHLGPHGARCHTLAALLQVP